MRTNWSEWRYASLDDRRACRRLIRQGSRSFFAASLLLPADLRDPAYAVYGYCRLADDDVDLASPDRDPIARLRRRLDAIYDGRPLDYPSDRALADVVAFYDLPRALFDALLEGLEWDDRGRRYDTIEELHAYAARVASAVGAIMTCLMGRRAPDTLARACELGVAMQLTNIARDIGEDARAGRLYLPRTWLLEAGIDPARFLAEPVMSPALGAVIERLLAHADHLYQRSLFGIADLPPSCRPAINAARRLYAEIGAVVARNGHDSISRRAVVPTRRKLGVVLQAVAEAAFASARAKPPSLAATRFLIDAVTEASAYRRSAYDAEIETRTEWVIDLFERLRERDRLSDARTGTA